MTANLNSEAIRSALNAGSYELRLLPWESPGDKPCFLSTDDGHGVMSRYADDVEAEQLANGATVLTNVERMLADPAACRYHLRLVLREAAESLSDVLRVAESRGARLSLPRPGQPALDGEESGSASAPRS
ncbi:hypothetical protein ACFQ6V_27005 [Streptomyces roseifaciens]